jgi:hypothetical protein
MFISFFYLLYLYIHALKDIKNSKKSLPARYKNNFYDNRVKYLKKKKI